MSKVSGLGAFIASDDAFFDQDSRALAVALLGCVVRHFQEGRWLAARIIETEAYQREEKGSHASLGRTPSREPLFAAPGTLYLYHSQGGDSLNFSAGGEGNAVLIKGAALHVDEASPASNLEPMRLLSPTNPGRPPRSAERICSGQALLCRALGIKARDWTGRRLDPERLRLERAVNPPEEVLVARRLGIPEGRDEQLLYRFLDPRFAHQATQDPRRRRGALQGRDFELRPRRG